MSLLRDIEDMRSMALDPDQVRELVGDGGTCVLIWSTADGHPVGVLVAYVYEDGVFWTTTPAGRKRVTALRARPKSSVVVVKDGSSVTLGHNEDSRPRRRGLSRPQDLVLLEVVGHGCGSGRRWCARDAGTARLAQPGNSGDESRTDGEL